jgi:hypothetical protein
MQAFHSSAAAVNGMRSKALITPMKDLQTELITNRRSI